MQRNAADWGGNILALIGVLSINALANALPIGGQTTGQVSASYPSLVVPAGYVFSIWGLIYLGLIAFVIYQALPAQRHNPRLASASPWFAVNCVANAAWLFLWHYELIFLSALVMLVILGTLVMIYLRLQIGVAAVPAAERWLAHLPFSIYTGWITVATIANWSAFQLAQGWQAAGLDAATWAIVKLAAAGAIAAVLLFRRRDVAFALVVAWAGIGISLQQADTPAVSGAAAAIAALAGLLAVYALIATRGVTS